MAVIFPKVTRLILHGFDKIFTANDFEIDFSSNLSILLGGNGLGKTTLLQCIIYALTGGTDQPDVEDVKAYRWNHGYFNGRINDDAYVWIEFSLGENRIRVKRGFCSTRTLECTLSVEGQDIKDITFDELIKRHGNYNNISDFSFIVNRLLYLPENRRSLLWDYEAQIRTLMIISNDFVTEKEYRELRQQIKIKDSNKRKINWDIGKLEKRNGKQSTENRDKDLKDNSIYYYYHFKDKNNFIQEMQKLANERKILYGRIKADQEARNGLIQSITDIGNTIRESEANYVQEHLLTHDEKNAIIFHKTLKTGYCPACDQKSVNLRNIIQERIKTGKCLICGGPIQKHQHTDDSLDLDALNSQLYEKLEARNALDFRITQNSNKLAQIEESVSTIRDELSKLNSSYANDQSLDDEYDTVCAEDETRVIEEYTNLCQQRDELEIDIQHLTKHADDMHDTFVRNFQVRYDRLHDIYGDLACHFLGLPVELKYTKSSAKFVNLNYLIPHFSKVDRDSPETCSEAQRFFLDIAFRMSVISLNKEISGIDATFICETPENALDICYIDNVVKMFISYMQKDGNLILTTNLQYLGIAQTLIEKAKIQKIRLTIFDLLKYGKLSEIQTASKQLIDIRDAIFKKAEE